MNRKTIFAFLFVTLLLSAASASAQTPSFTHQGNLGFAANGQYDFELKLYDTPATGTGTQQGGTLQILNITVTNGDFTLASIDFGAAVFNGGELFLETGWRPAGGGVFTVLSPREKITAVYANRSLSAATADNATQLGGLPPTSFIQNTASQQPGSFNVAGNGTAGGTLSGNIINAATQFNISGSRILASNAANSNLFVGINAGAIDQGNNNSYFGHYAGALNTTGFGNTFIGAQAGAANTTGEANTFVGQAAGFFNTMGGWNSFFGASAGSYNTSGSNNAFFGVYAGLNNTTGLDNAFFGMAAGGCNTTGKYNSFFGWQTGVNNLTGSGNSFFGDDSGHSSTTSNANSFFGDDSGWGNTTGSGNVFVGAAAGKNNTTGGYNTAVGYEADLAGNNLTNATAIGANAYVQQSNSIVLGSINGVNSATADTAVGIGTTTPAFRLHVIDSSNAGLRVQTNATGGTVASFGGNGDFSIDGPGVVAGRFVVKEGGNVGIGIATPVDRLVVNGVIRVLRLGSAGSTQLCFNTASQISTCSSSLRYKTNIHPFSGGLSLINRLQPITFNWKAGGEADLGLGAEDVAKVEPLLVTHNEKGEIEGVKYDRVAVILLNAVKEQQQQIESLRRIVCQDHPHAGMCEAKQGLTAASRVKLRRRRSLATTHFGPVR